MTINVHPLLVHFPIALLTIYSILEIVSIKRLRELPYWIYVKASLLLIGTISILPTILAGLIIEDQFKGQEKLVDLHSKFGELSALVYGLLTVFYIYSWIKKTQNKMPTLVSALSIVGLVLLLITGALGGTIVYGPNLDIFTSFIYHIFFPNL